MNDKAKKLFESLVGLHKTAECAGYGKMSLDIIEGNIHKYMLDEQAKTYYDDYVAANLKIVLTIENLPFEIASFDNFIESLMQYISWLKEEDDDIGIEYIDIDEELNEKIKEWLKYFMTSIEFDKKTKKVYLESPDGRSDKKICLTDKYMWEIDETTKDYNLVEKTKEKKSGKLYYDFLDLPDEYMSQVQVRPEDMLF